MYTTKYVNQILSLLDGKKMPFLHGIFMPDLSTSDSSIFWNIDVKVVRKMTESQSNQINLFTGILNEIGFERVNYNEFKTGSTMGINMNSSKSDGLICNLEVVYNLVGGLIKSTLCVTYFKP